MTPHPAPLDPLRLVALGVLVCLLDLNLESFDVLFDPVGYALVAWGLSLVARLHPALPWGRNAAIVGVLTSSVGAFWRSVDGHSGTVVEHPFSLAADAVLETVIVLAVCTALLALSRDPRVLGPARTLRIALPAVSVLGMLLEVSLLTLARTAGEDPAVGDGDLTPASGTRVGLTGVVLVVAGLALSIWFLVVLLRAAREPVTAPGTLGG